MEKKNTMTVFDLLSSIFGDTLQCTEVCKCGHCENHTDEDEQKEGEEETVDITEYTDEDFKDPDKLDEYVEYLENLRDDLADCADNSLFKLAEVFGIDYNKIIDELIDHANNVYEECWHDEHNEEQGKTEEKPLVYTTEALAKQYVNEEILDKLPNLSLSNRKNLIDSYKKFADWIIEHK